MADRIMVVDFYVDHGQERLGTRVGSTHEYLMNDCKSTDERFLLAAYVPDAEIAGLIASIEAEIAAVATALP